jgi:hypothetical protein
MTLAVNIAQSGSNNVTFRNRIINGACVIDQRNAGASVTPSVNGTYLVDRWNLTFSQASKFSAQQNAGSVTPPAGYINYLGLTVVSSVSVGTGDYFAVQQPIEGLNVADLAWGTANAQAVTLSFWVRSSLTGTFGGALSNSAGSRSYPFTYTISAANTWELETITIPGDTSGTWLTTNGIGVYVRFGLGSGATYSGTAGSWAASNYFTATSAVSVVGTGSATFYFTGVQLEAGTTASPFEYRQYGTEYVLCQRYYETGSGYFNGLNPSFGNNNPIGPISGTNFQVTKRATPAITLGTATTTLCYTNSGSTNNINTQSFAQTVLVLTGGATSGMVITQPWIAAIEL